MSDVRFIRKNGRIIPIHAQRSTAKSINAGTFTGVAVAGTALNVAGVALAASKKRFGIASLLGGLGLLTANAAYKSNARAMKEISKTKNKFKHTAAYLTGLGLSGYITYKTAKYFSPKIRI